jgi:hypothetical protein
MRSSVWSCVLAACGMAAAGCDDGGIGGGPSDVVGWIDVRERWITAQFRDRWEPPSPIVAGACRSYPYDCGDHQHWCERPWSYYLAGDIHITGLHEDVTMYADETFSDYAYGGDGDLYDAALDDLVEVSATGGEIAGFSLSVPAAGIEPFDEPYAQPVFIRPGEPITITWPLAAATDTRVSFTATLGLVHGGVTHWVLECETTDTGTLVIDGSLTAEASAWGFGEVLRYREAALVEPGRDIRLRIGSIHHVMFQAAPGGSRSEPPPPVSRASVVR